MEPSHYELVHRVASKISEPRLRQALLQILDEHQQLREDLARARRKINDLDLLLKATVRENHPQRTVQMYKGKKRGTR